MASAISYLSAVLSNVILTTGAVAKRVLTGSTGAPTRPAKSSVAGIRRRSLIPGLAALVLSVLVMPTLTSNNQLHAQSSVDVSGSWRGILMAAQFEPLEIVFHIIGTGGTFSATLDIPSHSRIGVPVDDVSINGSNIILRMHSIQAEYYASLVMSDDDVTVESLNGDWSQSGEHIPLRMSKDSR